MEAGGVWSGPIHAARATRSHSPACAAPVVPPYTALAGACSTSGYYQPPTNKSDRSNPELNANQLHYSPLQLLSLRTNNRPEYQNDNCHGSAAANPICADSGNRSSRDAVPPGTGTATSLSLYCGDLFSYKRISAWVYAARCGRASYQAVGASMVSAPSRL